jgi:hypothetical protein
MFPPMWPRPTKPIGALVAAIPRHLRSSREATSSSSFSAASVESMPLAPVREPRVRAELRAWR